MNFWKKLSSPFFVQAPMEDVTDTVFRQIIATCGKPDVFFTEFTSTDGLCSRGKEANIPRLKFTPVEHPIVAQIWGNTPENYFTVAKLLSRMEFDGIDINFGCPARKVVGKDFCAGLIKNPDLAKQIIRATQKGAGKLPVSVKTRIGYSRIETEEWIGFLLKQNLAAITVHGRTVKELSKGPVHWEEIAKVVSMRNTLKIPTIIIGNGDVLSYDDGLMKHNTYGVDGVMIGRGILSNPWIFNKTIDPEVTSMTNRVLLLKQHLQLFSATWGNTRHFNQMRKFFKMYTLGLPHAASLRIALMNTVTIEEAISCLNKFEV
jgi:nifR3 family TIM-barrel protein